jgi:flagellar biosynthesis/type III secretory pathway M-ring protein FliF/YscJ
MLMALAGLLVLFGGIFPLLRRTSLGTVVSSGSLAEVTAKSAPSEHQRVEPAPMVPSSAIMEPFEVDAASVRTLVANDPARTAKVIKEWIARDRSGFRRAS